MSEATLAVVQVGPVSTVQDGGRPGFMRFGVPRSGPMDRRALAIANTAVGNPADTAGIEVSIGGTMLQCIAGAVTVAVAGGGFRVEQDGTVSPSWTRRHLQPGSVLSVRPGAWGSWTYVAFAGRLVSETWLGSAATHLVAGRGGGILKAGQQLTIADATVREGEHGPIPFPASARPKHTMRVVLGPQDRFFPDEAVAALLSQSFALSTAYDRMGVRLQGPLIAPRQPLDMPSEPILRGSLQVAGDGVATALLSDHQTTGGYPKIATIVADDVDAFVQLRPRERVTFQAIEPDGAVAAARTRQRAWADYLAHLRDWAGSPDAHGWRVSARVGLRSSGGR